MYSTGAFALIPFGRAQESASRSSRSVDYSMQESRPPSREGCSGLESAALKTRLLDAHDALDRVCARLDGGALIAAPPGVRWGMLHSDPARRPRRRHRKPHPARGRPRLHHIGVGRTHVLMLIRDLDVTVTTPPPENSSEPSPSTPPATSNPAESPVATRNSPEPTNAGSELFACLATPHGRGGGIRTHDLFVPNEARYQAAPHPA